MKGIIPQGKPWTQEASPPLPPQGAGYVTLRSRHSLGNGTIKMVPLLSLRLGITHLLLFALFLAAVPLSLSAEAQTHVIGTLLLEISGKTQEQTLKSDLAIVPYADEFASEAAMVRKLEERKKNLLSKRIYSQADYSCELTASTDEQMVYSVTYNIVEVPTVLFIPYGIYDSNYGGRAGIKLYDSNFLGIRSDLKFKAYLSQLNPSAFNQYKLSAEVTADKLQLFGKRLDLGAGIQTDTDGWSLKNSVFKAKANYYGMNIGPTSIDLFSDISLTKQDNTIFTWGSPTINFRIVWQMIPLLANSLRYESKITYYKLGPSWALPELTFTNQIRTQLFSILDQQVSGSLTNVFGYKTEDQSVITNDVDIELSTSFTIFEEIKQGLAVSLLTNHTAAAFETVEFASRNSFSQGNVDAVGNFREGYNLKLTLSTLMPLNKGIAELFSSFSTVTRLEASYYTMLGVDFNLGLRGSAFLATGTAVENPVDPGNFLRGITNVNRPKEYGFAGLNVSTGITFELFDFDTALSGYPLKADVLLTPFLDFSVFQENAQFIQTWPSWSELTGGAELLMIFNRLKKYPLSAVFGFSLLDTAAWLTGSGNFSDIDFEVVILLDMF